MGLLDTLPLSTRPAVPFAQRRFKCLFGRVALPAVEERPCLTDERAGVANPRNPKSELDGDTNIAARGPAPHTRCTFRVEQMIQLARDDRGINAHALRIA